ncbi:MAG: hypothetical protein K0S93_583 [Nitrososphaeraceae archaeon]|jgi:hypothetical protein|nr:hypothetical protein [Nitrososphaeraceae archaeon]
MKKIINETNTILILSIVLTIIVGIFNNANALFHEQELNNEKISDTSREFILNLFDNVNSVSNEFYQYEPDKEKESINKNITIVNKTNDYIGKLEKIISLAKEYNIQEEYKPILNNYINSLKNEIESHKHYKNYILTGNITENKLSENLLSKALTFEMEAIKEFKKLE